MKCTLKDARQERDNYTNTFIDYCNDLLIEDKSMSKYDFKELAMENLNSNTDHPYLIYVDNTIAGLVVFSDEDDIKEENSCHTYINEMYVKKEFRKHGIASDIVLSYLKSLKYDTGFCYVVGSHAEMLWLKLLDDNNYKYDIYQEDEIRNFVHVRVRDKVSKN